jgi:hypothetical protein
MPIQKKTAVLSATKPRTEIEKKAPKKTTNEILDTMQTIVSKAAKRAEKKQEMAAKKKTKKVATPEPATEEDSDHAIEDNEEEGQVVGIKKTRTFRKATRHWKNIVKCNASRKMACTKAEFNRSLQYWVEEAKKNLRIPPEVRITIRKESKRALHNISEIKMMRMMKGAAIISSRTLGPKRRRATLRRHDIDTYIMVMDPAGNTIG